MYIYDKQYFMSVCGKWPIVVLILNCCWFSMLLLLVIWKTVLKIS
jgi:hypothetical protein